MFWLLGLERHAEGRGPPVAPKGHSWAIRATGAMLGPKEGHSPRPSSTLRGLRWPTADEAAVRAEPDLIPNGRPLCSVVIALLEGAKKPLLSHPARLAAS
jgi:hypothetical protein